MNFFIALTLIFITLKLTGFIAWSWWLVTLPLTLKGVLWLVVTIWWESRSDLEKAKYLYNRGKWK